MESFPPNNSQRVHLTILTSRIPRTRSNNLVAIVHHIDSGSNRFSASSSLQMVPPYPGPKNTLVTTLIKTLDDR